MWDSKVEIYIYVHAIKIITDEASSDKHVLTKTALSTVHIAVGHIWIKRVNGNLAVRTYLCEAA